MIESAGTAATRFAGICGWIIPMPSDARIARSVTSPPDLDTQGLICRRWPAISNNASSSAREEAMLPSPCLRAQPVDPIHPYRHGRTAALVPPVSSRSARFSINHSLLMTSSQARFIMSAISSRMLTYLRRRRLGYNMFLPPLLQHHYTHSIHLY